MTLVAPKDLAVPKAPYLHIAIKVGAPGPLALEDPGLTHR